MTVREVAKALGMSKSRVHQIEQRALRKLRARLAEWADYVPPERRSNWPDTIDDDRSGDL